ncbi:phage portal protein [Bradyrhizobium sp. JYMT SZCCT0428]|uniref:phage portal protein n=1 Tax=Bradyrhizobium sp. JYMT SZCCT0428 TaxID=2807673 RepID=UPI001BA997BE|nr:phage portal protein [Bradyrhizobium sp. JYMT SZCCT0428]MBR1150100.1 phage portal protein [Bradyrhizobium sp. JYMT SZCCT0428]
MESSEVLPNPFQSSSGAVTVRASTSMSVRPEIETAHAAASLGARDMASWAPMRLSPDAAMLGELDTMVARSDDLARNNGIAAGAERTLVDNVVGPRLMCKPTPDRVALKKPVGWSDEWGLEVESLWSSFADTTWFDAADRLSFHGQTRLAYRTIASAGEVLALPLWLTKNNSRWNTCLQLVDPARLSNPQGRADTATLRNGVEIDRYGAPVAYNIRKTHPGDLFSFGLSSFGAGEWERIPAYLPFGRKRVIHLFDAERIGQNRGKPIVAAVTRMFNSFDKLMLEKLRVAVLDAMIFAAIETPLDQESMAELVGGDKRASFEAELKEWRIQMRGGTMVPLPPGTKMSAFTPARGTSELESFATLMLRHIAAGMNMPYELVFKDFSKTNYSSARAALLEGWRYFSGCRQFMIEGWATPVYELWFEEAVNAGDIPDCTPADFYKNRVAWTKAKWIGAGRGWIDPVKEATAAQLRMQMGISTLEDECAEQGRDWRQTIEQLAREQAYMREHNVVLNPVKVVQVAADQNEQDQDQNQQDQNQQQDAAA